MAEYIDRTQAIDAIEVHMYRQDPDDRGVYPLEDWQREQNYAYDLAMEILGNLPAADVKPVVRGKWEEREVFTAKGNVDMLQSAFCPVCKRYHTTPYSYYFTVYNYCPNCGADMREQEAKPEPAPGPYDLLHEEGGWNLQ